MTSRCRRGRLGGFGGFGGHARAAWGCAVHALTRKHDGVPACPPHPHTTPTPTPATPSAPTRQDDILITVVEPGIIDEELGHVRIPMPDLANSTQVRAPPPSWSPPALSFALSAPPLPLPRLPAAAASCSGDRGQTGEGC